MHQLPFLCKPKYHFDDFLSFLFNFRLHFSPRDHVPNLLNLRAPQWRQCMNGDLVCTLQCVVDYRVADTFLSRRSYYRVLFKLPVTVHQCLNGRAPPYLSRSTASRSPVLTRGGICVPPTVTYLPYRVSGSTLTAVGRSQLLARWPGTHSRILSGIQRAAQTVLGIYLKRTCSRVSSASSALAVLNDYALYKSTHSLTYSFTHSRVRIFL